MSIGAVTNEALPTPQQIVDSNCLTLPGKKPFYLQLSFQIFDLNGKPSEQGTLDYWWPGRGPGAVQAKVPSLGTVTSLGASLAHSPQDKRTLYLVDQLLQIIRAPVLLSQTEKEELEPTYQTKLFASVPLLCLKTRKPVSEAPWLACFDSKTRAFRFVQTGQTSIIRNRTGSLEGTHVGMEDQVDWIGLPAIRGEVLALRTMEVAAMPARAVSAESEPDPLTSLYEGQASGFQAGKQIKKPAPQYPQGAFTQRLTGYVVLAAAITKDGKTTDLFPVASADPLLTQAATDSVSRWTYTPYMLNGAPTAVSITILVNFGVNP